MSGDTRRSMTDRPILFSGPMVRALLDGRKTQTRRLLSGVPDRPGLSNTVHEPKHNWPYLDAYCSGKRTPDNPRGMGINWCWWTRDDRPCEQFRVGYAPGDRLWVRETWCNGPIGRDGVVEDWADYGYRASDPEIEGIDDGDGYKILNADGSVKSCWKPSIHMPRKASRLTLTVTDVRVQRLQDISEKDAIAEGVERSPHGNGDQWLDYPAGSSAAGWTDPRESFRSLWQSINGKRADSAWNDNPWVVALTFSVAKGNIDAIQQAEAA